MGRPKINVVEKFWAKVDRRADDECWLWTGSFDKDGYGQIWDGHAVKMKKPHKLCAEFKLVPSTVYRIWNGQAWKHSLAR